MILSSVQGAAIMVNAPKPIPPAVRHRWEACVDSPRREHRCTYCGQLTRSPGLRLNELCRARDRRKGLTDRRSSWMDS